MKRIILFLLCTFLLCGCNKAGSIGVIGGADGPTAVYVSEDGDEWGISMYTDDVTSKGLTLCIRQQGGAAEGTLNTGAPYSIEVFKDGEWVPQELKDAEAPVVWTLQGYLIPRNELTEWNVNFEHLYGKLPAGRYRIAKEISCYTHSGDEEKTYYAEFVIE